MRLHVKQVKNKKQATQKFITKRSSTFYIRAEIIADLPQDEVDVVLPWDWVGCHTSGGVGCSGDGHVLPRQEEDDTTIAGGWIEETHVVRTVPRRREKRRISYY